MNFWKYLTKIIRPADKPTKSTEKPLAQELPFSGWGFDDGEDGLCYRHERKDVVAAEAEGRAYLLRKMNVWILFREQADMDARAALFLLETVERHWSYKVKDFPLEQFARAVEQKAFGRCLLYVADCMTRYQCIYLLFAPDGSGFTIDYTEERMVDFHWNDVTTRTWPQLLSANPETLRPLCRTIFDTQISPRLTNPYITPGSLKEIPHEFLCGSEAELRRLTIAIIQSEPGLFDESREPVTVKYRAQTPAKRAYMMSVTRKVNYNPEPIPGNMGRLHSLCDLAQRLNTFTGITWKTWTVPPNRLGNYQREIHRIEVVVQPPSAHEQAESLLTVADWLEGKVRPAKRLRLLGVDEAI